MARQPLRLVVVALSVIAVGGLCVLGILAMSTPSSTPTGAQTSACQDAMVLTVGSSGTRSTTPVRWIAIGAEGSEGAHLGVARAGRELTHALDAGGDVSPALDALTAACRRVGVSAR